MLNSSPSASSSSSSSNDNNHQIKPTQATVIDHPLLHLSIWNRIQEKVPFLNGTIDFIGRNYNRFKSASGLIGNTAQQVEGQVVNVASLVVNFVPKKPVEKLDQLACQSLDMVENKVNLVKEFPNQIISLPGTIVEKVPKTLSLESIYNGMDSVLSFVEKQMDRFLPMIPHPTSKPLVEMNGGIGDNSNQINNFGYRTIGRILRFAAHFQLHLNNTVPGLKLLNHLAIFLKERLLKPKVVPLATSTATTIKNTAVKTTTNATDIIEKGAEKLKQLVTPEKKSPISNGNLVGTATSSNHSTPISTNVTPTNSQLSTPSSTKSNGNGSFVASSPYQTPEFDNSTPNTSLNTIVNSISSPKDVTKELNNYQKEVMAAVDQLIHKNKPDLKNGEQKLAKSNRI